MDVGLIIKNALALSASDRLRLMELLSRSLSKPDENIEKLWAEEAENRFEAVKSGKLKTVPLEEIIKKYNK